MRHSELRLRLRGLQDPISYDIATNERNRWIENHQPEVHLTGFSEFRTTDHYHLFISNRHVVAAHLLNDQMLEGDDDYDDAWKQRKDTKPDSEDFWPERWQFRIWIHGIEQPFEIDDLDEHDFVAISCGLLNDEHNGESYITVVDEDGEPVSFRVGDVMLAEGFDYHNYERNS